MFPMISVSALWIFAAVLIVLSMAAGYFHPPKR